MHNRTPIQVCRWHAVANEQTLQQSAIEMILAAAAQAIRERGQFQLVLAGGSTPQNIYRGLCIAETDWCAWHIYFGDERCLQRTYLNRNSCMTEEAWLAHVPIPANHIHVIPAELGAVEAARLYSETLGSVDDFDLVLLGLGEDGHTASLFPDHEWGTTPNSPDTLAVLDAPKPPQQRVSLSAARLSRARQVLFLVSGESKHRAVSAWRSGKNIPAQAITPAAGVDVLVESQLLLPYIAKLVKAGD